MEEKKRREREREIRSEGANHMRGRERGGGLAFRLLPRLKGERERDVESVCVSVSECVNECVSIHMSECPSGCVRACMYVHVSMCVCVNVRL